MGSTLYRVLRSSRLFTLTILLARKHVPTHAAGLTLPNVVGGCYRPRRIFCRRGNCRPFGIGLLKPSATAPAGPLPRNASRRPGGRVAHPPRRHRRDRHRGHGVPRKSHALHRGEPGSKSLHLPWFSTTFCAGHTVTMTLIAANGRPWPAVLPSGFYIDVEHTIISRYVDVNDVLVTNW